MNITLKSLILENAMGIKKLSIDFDGNNATIRGANGLGKTSIYSGFTWVLFDKNSQDKSVIKDFKLRPLDKDDQPIKGLVVVGEATLSFDGTEHTFRREHHEKIIKDEVAGYETKCYIDEVPKKVSEYQAYVSSLIPEDTFKMLTDLHRFNNAHWLDRRAILLDIAGSIGSPEGFDDLIALLKGRSVADYKKVLLGQENKLEEKQGEIGTRIDETQRSLDEYADRVVDTKDIEALRTTIKAEIEALDKKRQTVFASENARQLKLDALNSLKFKKLQREAELNNGTTGGSLGEKIEIEAGVASKRTIAITADNNVVVKENEIKSKQSELNILTKQLNDIRLEYEATKKAEDTTVCYACGQNLPQNKVVELQEKRKTKLSEIVSTGNNIKSDVDECKSVISKLNEELQSLIKARETANIELHMAEKEKAERFKQIETQINSREKVKPEKDSIWLTLGEEIKKAEKEIGKSASDQITAIDIERTEKQDKIKELDTALAQADTMKKASARIKELEADEKRISQQIANIEKTLSQIDDYRSTESEMIESAVNGKFKHVKFKLFNTLLNGEIEDCCDALYEGRPYSAMSTGEKIFVGIDIVNVLSGHYGLSVPLFIDNYESFTLPNEFNGQCIMLIADAKKKKLEVSIIDRTEKVA